MLTTETSYAAPVLRQESGQLDEPCHCGQTPRLPENKQRRGLEAAAEAGHHGLLSWANTALADGQVLVSIQAAQAALRKQETESTPARLDPRGCSLCSGCPHQCLLSIGSMCAVLGIVGWGSRRIWCLLWKGWLGQRVSALQRVHGP